MRFQPFVVPIVVIVGSLGLGYLIIKPAFDHAGNSAKRSNCLSNLKQISLAYAQYVRDSDRTSPPISRGAKGWADLLQPYAQSWEIFQCPAGRKSAELHRTDYFYNARLANVRSVPFPDQTILLGDGYDNSGANAHLSELPFDWKTDDSAERRHWYGSDYAFADGHVKFLWPEKIEVLAPSRKPDDWNYTFALR